MVQRPEGRRKVAPPQPRESAVGIVLRAGEGGGWEVLVGRRSRHSRFLPGNWAFLGGRVEAADRPGEPGAHRRCAAREVAEESGIGIPPEEWMPAGLLVTPPLFRLRFRTEFFLALAPRGAALPEQPPVPEEIEELRFERPGALIERWELGEIDLPPVLPPQLRRIAAAVDADPKRLARQLRADDEFHAHTPRTEFYPGIWMLPMESCTWPPATHTNTWLPGGERFLIVDPGGKEPEDLARLGRVVDLRRAEGSTPVAIFLTHRHRDHTEGALPVAERHGLPIWASAYTLDFLDLPAHVPVRRIDDGDTLDLGGLLLQAHDTSGHTPGHLALEVVGRRLLIAGDLISGLSTVLVDPRDGDMGRYMESLERMGRRGFHRLLPSHGPPQPADLLDRTLARRRHREAAILTALEKAPLALAALAEQAYADRPALPRPLIEAQALSHLMHLERTGRARREAERWRLRPAARRDPPDAERGEPCPR